MRPLAIIFLCLLGMFLFKTYYWDKNKSNDSKTPKASGQMVSDTSASTSARQNNVLSADIYVAKLSDNSSTIYATGTIMPNEEVEIKSEVAGRIIDLNIKEGGFVQKGQRVVKLDDRDLTAQLKKLEYEDQLAAQIEARQKKLLDINAISKEEYDMAVNRVKTLSADRELLQVQIERTSILTPFSGRMGLKSISEGAYITPGQIIVNIVQSNPAKVDFSISEKYSNKIFVGQKLSYTIDGFNDVFTAEVIAIDPKIDENLRTLRIRGKSANNQGRLLPGMYVRLEIPISETSAIMLPTEAIVPILKGKKVYVLNNGVAEERLITTGYRSNAYIQVEKGLSIGDSVIVSALMTIKPNMPVQARNVF